MMASMQKWGFKKMKHSNQRTSQTLIAWLYKYKNFLTLKKFYDEMDSNRHQHFVITKPIIELTNLSEALGPRGGNRFDENAMFY